MSLWLGLLLFCAAFVGMQLWVDARRQRLELELQDTNLRGLELDAILRREWDDWELLTGNVRRHARWLRIQAQR